MENLEHGAGEAVLTQRLPPGSDAHCPGQLCKWWPYVLFPSTLCRGGGEKTLSRFTRMKEDNSTSSAKFTCLKKNARVSPLPNK